MKFPENNFPLVHRTKIYESGILKKIVEIQVQLAEVNSNEEKSEEE